MDQNEFKKATTAKMQLDEISPSFCTVKWKHATMNLGSGAVKSCCHLPFRKVETENLKNGFELHDTPQDREERMQMLNGEKPKDCSYCWWIEEKGHFSDRITWSSKSWMSPYTKEVAERAQSSALNPSWLELNFSNLCNLKCSYCSPIFSSRWLQEIKEHGPYPTTPGHNDINYLQGVELNEKFDNTELMTQFWPWFEKCYPDLRLLKVTGGEPFLSPHTFKVLQKILDTPNPQMEISINSNLTVPESAWNQAMDLIIRIHKTKSSQKFHLQPSIDTFGARAEYIRHGLDFKVFQAHVADYLDRSEGNLIFIGTINNLALGGLQEFWSYLLDLKKFYGPKRRWVSITSEVLIGPAWQNINILPSSFQRYLTDTIEFVTANLGPGLDTFSTYELQGLTRALDLMKTPAADIEEAQKNFYRFFSEHDRRRNTEILKVFPEMKDFWNHCAELVAKDATL